MKLDVVLRAVAVADIQIFYDHQSDPVARQMAAFVANPPLDRHAFEEKWKSSLADDANVNRAVVVNGATAGYVACFMQLGQLSISYWFGRDYWGKGIATRAVRAFLPLISSRPLYARAAKDNVVSLAVLIKCGFDIVGEDKCFADARGVDVEEFIFRLDCLFRSGTGAAKLID
jgi:RimJ/RimL family protein N-acetyltransferase